ncbi:MAG: hypothetical protein K8I27_12150 [Planctomycetes bacterium]|nr:hypothetical protein [Planctomycetota bacterium]
MNDNKYTGDPATHSYLDRRSLESEATKTRAPNPLRIASEFEREAAETRRRCATGAYDVVAMRNLYRESKQEYEAECIRMLLALKAWLAVDR